MEDDETVTGSLEAVVEVRMSFMDSADLRMEGWLLGCRGALPFPPSRGLSSCTLGERELECGWYFGKFVILTLSYSSKINGYLYHQRFSPRPDMLSEVNAAHPFGCDSPLEIVMAVWHLFWFNSNFLGRVRQPSADNNGAPKGHRFLQRVITPDQITQQNSLQRAEAP